MTSPLGEWQRREIGPSEAAEGQICVFVPCQPMVDEVWEGSEGEISVLLRGDSANSSCMCFEEGEFRGKSEAVASVLGARRVMDKKEEKDKKEKRENSSQKIVQDSAQGSPHDLTHHHLPQHARQDSYQDPHQDARQDSAQHPTQPHRSLGGAEVNTARILAKISPFCVMLAGCLGEDSEGEFALNRFHSEGLSVQLLQKCPSESTAKCLVLVAHGCSDRAMISYLGAASKLPECAFSFGAYGVLYLSGYVLRLPRVREELFCRAVRGGKGVFVNLSALFCIDANCAWLQENWARIDGLFCNAEEAVYLAGRLWRGLKVDDAEKLDDAEKVEDADKLEDAEKVEEAKKVNDSEAVKDTKAVHATEAVHTTEAVDSTTTNSTSHNHPASKPRSTEEIARFIAKQGVGVVVITDGVGDTVAATHKGTFQRVPVTEAMPQRPVIDATGAGDSFVGGFLSIWLQNNNYRAESPPSDSALLERAIRRGHAFAECIVKARGVDTNDIE